MTPEWLEDGRKVPDDVMYYIRRMAVYAVRVLGQSPEKVAEAYNFDRSCIYRWLKQYDGGGFEALESHMPRGSDPIITKATDDWMKPAVLDSTPVDFGYDTNLWACPILAALLRDKFGVTVSDTAVRQHLKAMGLTCQKPEYQGVARDEGEMGYSIQDGTVNGERYIGFLGGLIEGRKRPLIVLADHATFHHSKQVRDYVRAHRSQLRVFFLPKRAPEYNPDEQVWNEVKNNRIGKQPVKNKEDLRTRLTSALDSLKQNSQRIISFFHLPDTKYAAGVA